MTRFQKYSVKLLILSLIVLILSNIYFYKKIEKPKLTGDPETITELLGTMGSTPKEWTVSSEIEVERMWDDIIKICHKTNISGDFIDSCYATEYWVKDSKTMNWEKEGRFYPGQEGMGDYCDAWEKAKAGYGMKCSRFDDNLEWFDDVVKF